MSSAAASTCPEYSCRGRTPAASRTRAQPGRQRAARYRRRREQQQRAATARRAPRRRRAALLGHVAACTRICTWTPWSLGAWPCCDARNCLAGVAASAAAAALRTVAAEHSGRGGGGDDCHRRAAVEGGEARHVAAPPTAATAAATGETRACASRRLRAAQRGRAGVERPPPRDPPPMCDNHGAITVQGSRGNRTCSPSRCSLLAASDPLSRSLSGGVSPCSNLTEDLRGWNLKVKLVMCSTVYTGL